MERGSWVLSLAGAMLICTSAVFGADRLVPSVYPTIQAGINAAVNGDRVIIAQGTYTGADNRDLDFGGRAITVQSEDPNDWDVVAGTLIDCQYGGRGFYFHSGETASSVLAGLTITNGYADFGGGIFCTGSSPTIRNCKLTDNIADYGGGMGNQNCSPTVTECMFVGNGVYGCGGGMSNSGCTLAVSNCIFAGNSALMGGGMENIDCSGSIVNCTFSGNSADLGGGIDNCGTLNPNVSNCILWGDSAFIGPEICGDASVSYCDVQGGYAGAGNIDADPCFVDAAGGDYHLQQGSPCIDAGDPGYTPEAGETDIDGEPRVMGLQVDMGADELTGTPAIIIRVLPTEFEFQADIGGPNPAEQILLVWNGGAGTLNWQITQDCGWLTVVPNSGSSTGEIDEVTLSVDISGLAAGNYNCEITVSDPNAENSPQAVAVSLTIWDTQGLVSLWQFEEGQGTMAYDSVGGNDGAIYGASWTSGMIGGGLSFDGVDDYVDVGNDSSLKPPLPITLCAWIKMSSLGSYQPIIALDDQTYKYYGIWFVVKAEDNLGVSYGDGGFPGPTSRRSKVGTTVLDTNTWYHIAAVVEGPADMNLYVNGMDNGGTYSGTGGSLAYSSASSLIGVMHGGGYALGGKIDEVRVYERALSEQEILGLHATGVGVPAIGVWPEIVDFYADEGGSNPASQTISVRNTGVGVLDWRITEDCPWLEVEPNAGTSTGETNEVNASVDISGLSGGWYECTVSVSDPCAFDSPRIVEVRLLIGAAGDLHVPAQYPTIQSAIDAAVDGNTVVVAPLTYTGSGNKDLDFGGKAITVRSVDPEDPYVVAATVIDCENSGRGFYFHSGEEANSVLAGFTIKRGKVRGEPAKGGAIYCSGASPTIKNCVITSNSALGSSGDPDGGDAYGGGAYCESNSYLTLIDCTVSNNRAIGGNGDSLWCSPHSGCTGGLGAGGGGYGGGIYGSSDSGLTIVDCIISNNSASGGSGGVYYETGSPMEGANGGWAWGGGVYCGSVATIINNCSIVSNTVMGGDGGQVDDPFGFDGDGGLAFGGGVCGQLAMSNCTIQGNEALRGSLGGIPPVMDSGGGGVCCLGSSTIENCLIVHNHIKNFYGSAVCHKHGGPCLIAKCTVLGNTSDEPYVYAVSGGAEVVITDSIIWGHDGYDVSSCSVTYSCTEQGVPGIGNIDADPCFVSGPEGDYHLSAFSLCIDSGDPCYSPTPRETDIDGDPRVMMDGVDIGADEFLPQTPFISIVPIEFNLFPYVGGPNPEPQILSIRNKGIGTLNWEIMDGCSWLSAEPNSGSSTGEIDEVTLSVDISGLAGGYYNCDLTISADAENSPQNVGISLYVRDASGELHVPSEYPMIQAAIDAAVDGDNVIIAQGTYTGDGNRDLDFLGKAITVRSTDPNDPDIVAATVIDCNGTETDPHRGFYFHSDEDANSIVSGLTIKRGNVSSGGGVCCSGASPTIENCTITNNKAQGSNGANPGGNGGNGYGGGICCKSGSNPRITYCTICNNEAVGGNGGESYVSPSSEIRPGDGGDAFGGGIFCSSDSHATIQGCSVADNNAMGGNAGPDDFGVFFYAYDGDAYGGGIYGRVTVVHCTVNGNFAQCGFYWMGYTTARGAGICCLDGASIINTVIADNLVDGIGGAFGAVYGAEITLTNCTVCDNEAIGGSVGGVYGQATTAVTNCILWGNGDDLYGCSATYSCIEDNDAGIGNIHADPCFVTGPEGDYYLSQIAAGQGFDSPCLDAGSSWASKLGMGRCTTRTDEVNDVGIVDMGYHYGDCNCGLNVADIDRDFDVDFADYALFAAGWNRGNSMTIPRGSVVVDGELSEWADPNMEWLPLDKIYLGSPNDVNEAKFALQWDPDTDKVYAAVIVQDNDHVLLDEYVNWDASDRIEVYSQGDAEGGSGWHGIYDVAQHYMVAPDTTGGSWATWALGQTLSGDEGLEYAVRVEDDEIVYEIGVTQFDNYGGFSGGDTIVTDINVGSVVGFDVVVDTRWSDGFGMLSENLMTGKYLDADQFAMYMLVEEPGGPPCFERTSDLDGNCVVNFADLAILVDSWLAGAFN